jgi:hypothetical protein
MAKERENGIKRKWKRLRGGAKVKKKKQIIKGNVKKEEISIQTYRCTVQPGKKNLHFVS